MRAASTGCKRDCKELAGIALPHGGGDDLPWLEAACKPPPNGMHLKATAKAVWRAMAEVFSASRHTYT